MVRLNEVPLFDQAATYLGNLNEYVAKVCNDLAAHPILSTAQAIDALGLSQGGLFLRAYVQRCNKPQVRSLVTFGTPHNGIMEFRECTDTDLVCRATMALLHTNKWSDFAQSWLVPAQYFRSPSNGYESYLEHSNFLADINNERESKNMTYAKNLASLEKLAVYMFEEESVVLPKDSSWFDEVNGTEITPLRQRQLYLQDWIGLRQLDQDGGLDLRAVPGDHMQLTTELLMETFREYYGPLKSMMPEPLNIFNNADL
jgi:palmitoyl-protein thioesterase